MPKCTKAKQKLILSRELLRELHECGLGARLYDNLDGSYSIRLKLHGRRSNRVRDVFSFDIRITGARRREIYPGDLRTCLSSVAEYSRINYGKSLEGYIECYTTSSELASRIIKFYNISNDGRRDVGRRYDYTTSYELFCRIIEFYNMSYSER